VWEVVRPTYVCPYMYVLVCMSLCVCPCMCALLVHHTHTHTHTHTHAHTQEHTERLAKEEENTAAERTARLAAERQSGDNGSLVQDLRAELGQQHQKHTRAFDHALALHEQQATRFKEELARQEAQLREAKAQCRAAAHILKSPLYSGFTQGMYWGTDF